MPEFQAFIQADRIKAAPYFALGSILISQNSWNDTSIYWRLALHIDLKKAAPTHRNPAKLTGMPPRRF
jgi:hypothetical protein